MRSRIQISAKQASHCTPSAAIGAMARTVGTVELGTAGTVPSKSMSQRYVSSRVLANQLRADRPDCKSVL